MNTTTTETTTVAHTIAAQIGRPALFMLGAKDILGDANSLSFKIRGSKAVQYIKITLDASDTYTVTFMKKLGRFDWKTVSELSDVYADSLHTVIESATGLYTKL